MVARIACTGCVLLLAAAGFFGAAPAPGGPFDPLGILALVLSGVIWFGWDMIQASYAYRDEICPGRGAGFLLTTERLGPVLVDRLVRKTD
jgi:hypothetical protein